MAKQKQDKTGVEKKLLSVWLDADLVDALKVSAKELNTRAPENVRVSLVSMTRTALGLFAALPEEEKIAALSR